MKIPKSFALHGTTYSVVIVRPEEWEGEDEDVGYFIPMRCVIVLKAVNRQLMEHTFCHELVHAIVNAMGEDKLYRNEKFVDTFAGLLHQALLTAE